MSLASDGAASRRVRARYRVLALRKEAQHVLVET
jgi:hypothetical protein